MLLSPYLEHWTGINYLIFCHLFFFDWSLLEQWQFIMFRQLLWTLAKGKLNWVFSNSVHFSKGVGYRFRYWEDLEVQWVLGVWIFFCVFSLSLYKGSFFFFSLLVSAVRAWEWKLCRAQCLGGFLRVIHPYHFRMQGFIDNKMWKFTRFMFWWNKGPP